MLYSGRIKLCLTLKSSGNVISGAGRIVIGGDCGRTIGLCISLNRNAVSNQGQDIQGLFQMTMKSKVAL